MNRAVKTLHSQRKGEIGMKREFKLPDLGEGVHECEILRVFVSEGDWIEESEPLLEVETDKAAVEIPSPFTGKILDVLVREGDVVNVGDVLVVFGETERKEDAGEMDEEKQAEVAGVEPEQPEKKAYSEKRATESGKRQGPVPASPSTRRLARELSVDLESVPGSGPEGLVTAEDVRSFGEEKGGKRKEKPDEEAKAPREEKAPDSRRPKGKDQPPSGISPPPMPDFSRWGEVEKIPVRSIRKATANRLALSWSVIPHVTNQDSADITRLEHFRKRRKEKVAEKGGNLTLTVFALKAAATALKSFPYFNASFDGEAGEIILKKYYHIGVAVNTDEGLVVPVIRDVDRKSITELAVELGDLTRRARNRELEPGDMKGGTFTITNAGPMGGGHFTPIINYPEVAILGMGKARMQPVIDEIKGERKIVARLLMPVVICFDHRIADGVDAIRFTRTIIDDLEDPDELFMTMV